MVYTVYMGFEWDKVKSESNVKKHGVTFNIAITAFDDPYALLAPDPRHSTLREKREWLIGESDAGVLVVVFTRREEGKVWRLISARPANKQERRIYEATKEFPL